MSFAYLKPWNLLVSSCHYYWSKDNGSLCCALCWSGVAKPCDLIVITNCDASWSIETIHTAQTYFNNDGSNIAFSEVFLRQNIGSKDEKSCPFFDPWEWIPGGNHILLMHMKCPGKSQPWLSGHLVYIQSTRTIENNALENLRPPSATMI